MSDYEYRRFKRRATLTIVIYVVFVLYLFHSPEDSIISSLFAVAVLYGLAFLALVFILMILLFATSLTGLLFRLWGDKEKSDQIVDSVHKATGLIPTLVVLALIAIPIYIILSNPYRFPVLHGIVSGLLSLKN